MNNLLVRGCRLYLESDYIAVSLKALSNFTYRVTMPYLNAVERVDQNDLMKILPQLCNDLKNGSPGNSLDNFHVEWTHVKMKDQALTSELDKFIQKEMWQSQNLTVHLSKRPQPVGDCQDMAADDAVCTVSSGHSNLLRILVSVCSYQRPSEH